MDIVITSFYIIIGITVLFLFIKTQLFSGYKIFYLFSLFFFGIAPMMQYENKESFFGARQLLKCEYLFQNLLIIFLLLGFHFLYKLFYHKFKFKINFRLQSKSVSNHYFFLISLLFLINKILVYPVFSLRNFFLRKGFAIIHDQSPAILQILSLLIFILPLLFCYHLLILWKNSLSLYRCTILLLLLFAGFPTTLSRTTLAILSVPLIFYIIPRLFKRNNFVYVFIAGFFYVFPFLDQFRRVTSLKKLDYSINTSVFNSAHFDSYYNFGLILNDIPIQWGKQLLGVILFFVPRELWISKPIGSGALMARKLNMTFDNLSANYFAEGYINFGYIGILIFLVTLAFITAIFDKFGHKIHESHPAMFYFYLQCIFLLFYLLRGDLMSSFALITMIIVLNTIVINILYKFEKNL